MPLQKQYVELPLALGGLGTGVDEKIVESPKMLQLKNVQTDKSGALNVRSGYAAHSITGIGIDDVTPIALAERGDTKIVVTDSTIAEYSPNAAGWAADNEYLPTPVACEAFNIQSSIMHDYVACDVCHNNGLIFVSYYTYVQKSGTPECGVYTYDPDSRTIVDRKELLSVALQPRLASVGDHVHVYFRSGSNLVVNSIDATDIDSGWTGNTTVASSATGTVLDVDYDSSFAYVGWEYSSQYFGLAKVNESKTNSWSVGHGCGSAAYVSLSVKKHYSQNVILVMVADSIGVYSNIIDSTDGSQDQTDLFTTSTDDVKNMVTYSRSSTTFQFLAEHDNGSTDEQHIIKERTVTISDGSIGSVLETYYNVNLAHKAVVDITNKWVKSGFIRANTYEAHVLSIQEWYDSGSSIEAKPFAKYMRGKMTGKPPDGIVSGIAVDSDSRYWFTYTGIFKVINEDDSIDTIGALGLAYYVADDNRRANYVSAQNLTIFTGGVPMCWDGQYAFPLGVGIAPVISSLTEAIGGSLTLTGTYSYIAVYEYIDTYGQIHMSAPSPPVSHTLTGSNDEIAIKVLTIPDWIFNDTYISHVSVALYRTADSGTVYYRIEPTGPSSIDASYNSETFDYTDDLADSALTDNQTLYTTGGILENNPPPPFDHAAVHKNRLFVVDNETGDIVHSKEFLEGEGIAFNDEFRIPTGDRHNRPIGLVSMDENLILFWSDKIGVIYGDGPNDLGLGGTFTLPRIVASIGATAAERRSIVKAPAGIFFKSDDGFKLLERSMQIRDIGRDVTDFNSSPVVGADLQESKHLVKFTCNPGNGTADVLVYNYLLNQWFQHNVNLTDEMYSEPAGSVVWDNNHIILLDAGTNRIAQEDSSIYYDLSATKKISTTVETNWIKLAGLQGYQRMWRFWLLGEYKGKHDIAIDVDFDYHTNSTQTFDINGITASTYVPYQIKLGPANQRCEAMKFTITLSCTSGETANALANLTAIRLEYGVDKRPYRLKNTYT